MILSTSFEQSSYLLMKLAMTNHEANFACKIEIIALQADKW
jgi:hypothetical protein